MTRKQPSRESLDRKNAAARAKRAVTSRERNSPVREEPPASTLPNNPLADLDRAAEIAEAGTAPVPCPFCSKLMPPTYGQPGVSLLRADGQTLICSDCGTREALEGGLRMTVSHFLETFTGSHELYYSDPMAKRLLTLTGHKAPWTPHSAKNIRAMIEARGLGGSYEGNAPGIAGYEMATDLAWTLCQFHSVKNGRGAIWRECIEALRGNGV